MNENTTNTKDINRMTKSELKTSYSQCLERINALESNFADLKNHVTVNVSEEKTAALDSLISELQTKADKIKEIYAYLFHKPAEGDSKYEIITSWINHFRAESHTIAAIKVEMLGETREQNGESVKITGYVERVKKSLSDLVTDHKRQHTLIESLLPGATSVNLSKNYNDKANEYKKERQKWQKGVIYILLANIIYFASLFLYQNIYLGFEFEFENLLLLFLKSTPIVGFSLILINFIGKNSDKSQKLEEIYKHKDAVAKAYSGYKKIVTEIDDEDESNFLQELTKEMIISVIRDPSIELDGTKNVPPNANKDNSITKKEQSAD